MSCMVGNCRKDCPNSNRFRNLRLGDSRLRLRVCTNTSANPNNNLPRIRKSEADNTNKCSFLLCRHRPPDPNSNPPDILPSALYSRLLSLKVYKYTLPSPNNIRQHIRQWVQCNMWLKVYKYISCSPNNILIHTHMSEEDMWSYLEHNCMLTSSSNNSWGMYTVGSCM